MTETGTDPGRRSGHLDADVVADLDEGLLPPAEAAHARAHLAGCADCAALDTALSDLRLLLASTPEPGPVPVEIATRVDEALARAQAAEDLRGAATVRPLASRAVLRTWRLRTVLGGLAAVAAAGLVAVPLLQGTGGGDETVSGAASDSAGASRSGGGVTDLAPENEPGGGYRVVRSGADYLPATLAASAARLLAGARSAPPAFPSPPVVLADPLAHLEDPEALRACVAAVQALDAAAGSTPLAVDLATYAGLPAAVLLLPLAPPSPGQALAVAVDPSCGTGTVRVRGRAVVTR